MAAPPKTLVIQTNAQCGMCKASIEKQLTALDGVKEAVLDLETKQVTVTYKGKKVDEAKLRQAISDAGYQADDVAPNPDAQAKLMACCQPKEAKAGGCCAPKAGASCAKKEGTK
ncbi:heavy-metal-associated domain-containing protein [Neolewinella aurantiaca]|uniref:Heavy-metal-associated domain-containing protein n=2 Tax=Neolewinella aurantiaca TaxID=2602767 RepID=A0A5C7FWT9_9BACT|nr:heavy-metal-associated domain-containing protein [Neolewinella aurantiaca]